MDEHEITRAEQMRVRTRKFAVRVLQAFRSLNRSPESRILGSQMLRSGTSVAANYRAACRARSRNEFIAKLGIVSEETDETEFWLSFFIEAGMLKEKQTELLLKEAGELNAIFSTSLLTAKANAKLLKSPRRKKNSPITQ